MELMERTLSRREIYDGRVVRLHVDEVALPNGKTSVREVIEAARTITGRRIPTEMAPGREGDPPALVASPEKARRVLGWKPDYDTIEEMISSAWSWHRKHPDGYR